jgi:hypothetical protein
LDVFPVTTPEPIRAMTISRQSKMIFVSSDSKIKQVKKITKLKMFK